MQIRPITDDEVPALRASLMLTFGGDPESDPRGDERFRALVEAGRAFAAFDEQVNTQRADRDRVDEAKDNLAEARREYTAEGKARLAKLDARIDELQARGDEKSDAAARDLKVRRDELAARLDRAGDETDSSWEEFKSDVKTGFDVA